MFKVIIEIWQKNVPSFLHFDFQFPIKNQKEKNNRDRIDDDGDRFEDFDERERI